MIFFFNASGDLIKKLPENVRQGSNKASRIYYVMPISANNNVSVAFTLPNGKNSTPRLMTKCEQVDNIVSLQDYAHLGVWYHDLLEDVTAYAGELVAQFNITNGEETIKTERVTIEITPGVADVTIPKDFDSYGEILQALTDIQLLYADIKAIKDVQVDGDSIVEDGVANITKDLLSKFGFVTSEYVDNAIDSAINDAIGGSY